MLHTLSIPGSAWTREQALAAAARQANKLFGSIAILSDKHVASVTPVFLTDPGRGPQAVTLVYVLNVPGAIAQALDEQLSGLLRLEETLTRPKPQKPGDAWLYSHGIWTPIQDPCSYPENWTVEGYRRSLEVQGYRYECDVYDLDEVSCPSADEVTVGFAVYIADDPEETGQRPSYPYRVEARMFLTDLEPPIYITDYPSLLELLAAFAPIVQTRLRIAQLVAQTRKEDDAD